MLDHVAVVSVQFVAVLWAVAGIAVVLAVSALRKAHRRRFARLASVSLVSLLTIALATADTVNAHFAFLPTVGDVRAALTGDRQWLRVEQLGRLPTRQKERAVRAGATVRMHVPADAANGFGVTTVITYLPPQYFTEPASRFPVAYLFHGSPGRPADWFHGGEAASVGLRSARAGHPVILVAPQLSRSWTDDPECLDGAKERVESHLFGAVIPSVDRTFRTRPNRTSRIFAGMSAGGYCALNLGLRHRDVAATILDLSGFTEPTHTGGVARLLGARGATDEIAANTPAHYVTSLPRNPATRVWLDAGSSDRKIVDEMASLAPALRARGMEVQWRERSGGHTFWVWTAALQESLPWAMSGAPGRPTHNPSRAGPAHRS
ncbi:MAG: esterase [Pseudonocardiales bacterium]|nr:esterase [Pseudonocardiales bacterium]